MLPHAQAKRAYRRTGQQRKHERRDAKRDQPWPAQGRPATRQGDGAEQCAAPATQPCRQVSGDAGAARGDARRSLATSRAGVRIHVVDPSTFTSDTILHVAAPRRSRPCGRMRLEPCRKIRRERSRRQMEAAEAACIRRHPRPRGRWLDRWQRSGRKGVRRHAAPGWHARLVGNKRLQRPNHWACNEVPVRQGGGRNTSHPAMRATRHGVVGTARICAAAVGGLAQAMAGGHAGGGHRHPRDNQSQSDDHGNHETAQPVQHG